MTCRAFRPILAAVVAASGWASGAQARADTETHPFPGLTYITRTLSLPSFTCFLCPRPTPNPRIAKINIVLVDLTAPEIHFRFTPRGSNFGPVPLPPPNGFPTSPPFETNRQRTVDFLEAVHGQAAINSHFFAPFPSSLPDAYLIGLAASRGDVYSGFESPFQSYAIVTDSPAVNIDRSNQVSIVHHVPGGSPTAIVENVQLWNTLAGSAQIVTNGITTIPEYKDGTPEHADAALDPIPPYSRAGRHWYDLSNGRTAIGFTQDGRTLVLFTVDGTNGGNGMQVGEVADLLRNDYHVWNALNLDGGGSTTMAMEDPVTHVRRVVNAPSDNPNVIPPGRAEASNLAVYSDGNPPTTAATVAPAPNASGWNNTGVTVSLHATDLASGILDTPAGWVDQLQYSLAGAQSGGPVTVPGSAASPEISTSFPVSAPGVTTLTYAATDAAGNEETPRTLDVRLDSTPPDIIGMPIPGWCAVWPPNHRMWPVAVVTASDALSGVASLEVTGTSNEPPNAHEPDVVVTPDGAGGLVVSLRAERLDSGSGRVYTLTATARDRADNVSTVTRTCVVPHDARPPR